MQKADLAPRFAFAYSPNVGPGFWHKLFGNAGDSVLRAGYGIYYDHFGESIVNLFDQYGSFGLSNSITNPTNVLTPGHLAALHRHSRHPRPDRAAAADHQLSGAIAHRSADHRLRHHPRHRRPDEDALRACGQCFLAAPTARRICAGSRLPRDASDAISCSRSIWRSRSIWSTQEPGRITSPPPRSSRKTVMPGRPTSPRSRISRTCFPTLPAAA